MDILDLPKILNVKLIHLDMGYLLMIEAGPDKRSMFTHNIREAKKKINEFITETYLETKGGD